MPLQESGYLGVETPLPGCQSNTRNALCFRLSTKEGCSAGHKRATLFRVNVPDARLSGLEDPPIQLITGISAKLSPWD